MEVSDGVALTITEPSGPAEARHRARALATSLGLDETTAGRLALVVTEAATNLVKHAGGGDLLLRPLWADGVGGIEVLALDRGDGIPNLSEALRDGHSTSGSPGTGLGAISRLSTVFDIHTRRGVGTAVLARIWGRPPARSVRARPLDVAGVAVARPGETVCGDAWTVVHRDDGATILVADGLGHGVDAAEAAREAVRLVHGRPGRAPAEVLEAIHAGLRPTRGAAVGVAEVDLGRRVVRFAGLGNIAGTILSAGGFRSVVSHNGIAGHEARRIQEFSYPFPDDGLLVLHSDGLKSQWSLHGYPGLGERDPALIAGILYRDFNRGRDDVTVVVARASARRPATRATGPVSGAP
jgi:anti-sigma regulatory factor (Ser/Thr protein kinase)